MEYTCYVAEYFCCIQTKVFCTVLLLQTYFSCPNLTCVFHSARSSLDTKYMYQNVKALKTMQQCGKFLQSDLLELSLLLSWIYGRTIIVRIVLALEHRHANIARELAVAIFASSSHRTFKKKKTWTYGVTHREYNRESCSLPHSSMES